jgi:hypothetical protein
MGTQQDNTKTRQHKARQDTTKQDKTTQSKTTQHEARQMKKLARASPFLSPYFFLKVNR